MMLDVQRYVAVTADETRSIVVMCGGSNNGVIPVNSGPSFSARVDRRVLRGAWVVVTRGGVPVSGLVASIVTLTGFQGDTWMLQLGSGCQGVGNLIALRGTPLEVHYGWGALLQVGALASGDLVQLGCSYD